MKLISIVALVPFVVFVVGGLCRQVSADVSNSPRGLQIVTPINHTFQLELNELKAILERDEIKNHHISVISIAGAFRQGKSFLLNFFIRFLNAQYKRHDVSDWIGEKATDNKLDGFKFRGGRRPETIGIWVWSDIYTHQYENGDKVAIILMDTQGIFDSKSSVHDCTAIFALSTLLSSVQCYNLMQNVKEDDLQHLELFTQYGRLVLEQSNEKPFQKLIFIIRDWPYAFETSYGWGGHRVVDEFLAVNNDQTDDMHGLRSRIRNSFDQIDAFLMPHPGFIVAQSNNFTGDLQQISPEFITYVKQLVPGIFAPENLIVKKINGQKLRARDLIEYLEAYTTLFNGNTLPEPKTVLRATAEAYNHILYTDCLNHYIDSMQMPINTVQTYYKESDLLNLHQNTKNKSLAEFLEKPKLGGDEVKLPFQRKLESDVEEKFQLFKSANEQKRQDFIRKANLHNENLTTKIYESTLRKMNDDIRDSKVAMKQSDLNAIFGTVKGSALEEFSRNKMGDDEICKGAHDKLAQNIDNFHLTLSKTLEMYNECESHYENSMQSALDRVEYFHQSDLMKLHQNTKNTAISQFMDKTNINDALKFTIRNKLDGNIEVQYRSFNDKNVAKHSDFVRRANTHNDNVCREIKAKFENNMRKRIGRNYLNNNDFINLFLSQKQDSLNEFGGRKMGDVQISNVFRERLEREMDGLQASLQQTNEANKPPPPRHDGDGRNKVERFFHKVFGW